MRPLSSTMDLPVEGAVATALAIVVEDGRDEDDSVSDHQNVAALAIVCQPMASLRRDSQNEQSSRMLLDDDDGMHAWKHPKRSPSSNGTISDEEEEEEALDIGTCSLGSLGSFQPRRTRASRLEARLTDAAAAASGDLLLVVAEPATEEGGVRQGGFSSSFVGSEFSSSFSDFEGGDSSSFLGNLWGSGATLQPMMATPAMFPYFVDSGMGMAFPNDSRASSIFHQSLSSVSQQPSKQSHSRVSKYRTKSNESSKATKPTTAFMRSNTSAVVTTAPSRIMRPGVVARAKSGG